MKEKLKQGQRVAISRLNNENSIHAKGTICGISAIDRVNDEFFCIYIVEVDDVSAFRSDYAYKCVSMSEGCLDKIED